MYQLIVQNRKIAEKLSTRLPISKRTVEPNKIQKCQNGRTPAEAKQKPLFQKAIGDLPCCMLWFRAMTILTMAATVLQVGGPLCKHLRTEKAGHSLI